MREKPALLRITRGEDGNFLLDKTGKLPGRGAYVCRAANCVSKASKAAGVERSFRQKSKDVSSADNEAAANIYAQLAMEVDR